MIGTTTGFRGHRRSSPGPDLFRLSGWHHGRVLQDRRDLVRLDRSEPWRLRPVERPVKRRALLGSHARSSAAAPAGPSRPRRGADAAETAPQYFRLENHPDKDKKGRDIVWGYIYNTRGKGNARLRSPGGDARHLRQARRDPDRHVDEDIPLFNRAYYEARVNQPRPQLPRQHPLGRLDSPGRALISAAAARHARPESHDPPRPDRAGPEPAARGMGRHRAQAKASRPRTRRSTSASSTSPDRTARGSASVWGYVYLNSVGLGSARVAPAGGIAGRRRPDHRAAD